eukprot:5623772-Pyramimonas_sp.AAC.1
MRRAVLPFGDAARGERAGGFPGNAGGFLRFLLRYLTRNPPLSRTVAPSRWWLENERRHRCRGAGMRRNGLACNGTPPVESVR